MVLKVANTLKKKFHFRCLDSNSIQNGKIIKSVLNRVGCQMEEQDDGPIS